MSSHPDTQEPRGRYDSDTLPIPDPPDEVLAIKRASGEAALELIAATGKFGPMASPHEGWAVIREELDELWELVKANDGRGAEARREAIQVAAMALRYVIDLSGEADA